MSASDGFDRSPPALAGRVVPEIILVDDTVRELVGPVLNSIATQVDDLIETNSAVRALFASNGWTARHLAWRHLIAMYAESLAEHGWTFETEMVDERSG